MAHYLPSLVVPPIVARLRHETESFILPGEEDDLRRYLAERRGAGIRLNLNQLGEAILGEEEAARRLEAYLALLARDDVEYISVKVSSVSSQIDLVAFRAHRRGRQGAAAHALPPGPAAPLPPSRRSRHAEVRQPRHGGVPRPRPHRRRLPRGAGRGGVPAAAAPASCCRPTCPTRTACSASSRAWAIARGPRAAARRSSCASSRAPTWRWSASRPALHGWPQAPYADEARGRRQLQAHARVRLPPRHAPVPCTSASPATTSSTWPTASLLREDEGVEPWVEFEMLEGMANHQARAVQARAGGPPALRAVVRAEDFAQRHRLPGAPARREHAPRTTSSATSSASSRARPRGRGSATGSSPPSTSSTACRTRPGAARTAPRGAGRGPARRRTRRRRSPTSRTPTGRSPPTATGSPASVAPGASARRRSCRSSDRRASG